MKITNKDIDSLKQLDRIEYRQKREECKMRLSSAVLSCFLGMGFFIIAVIIDSAVVVDTDSLYVSYFGVILFMCLSLFFCFGSNKKIDELHYEYFKIEKK